MSRTNDLRELVQNKLLTIEEINSNAYYENADENNMYPHIVFSFSQNLDLQIRSDITIDIDIWDKSTNATVIENVADKVEDLFNSTNNPQETILPTFYLIDRKKVPDEDKRIKHRLIRVLCQNYEK